MARTETIVQLTQPLLELLDREAARQQISRSQLIREAVAVYLQSAQRHAHDQQMVEGYTQAAADGEDDPASSWGQPVRRDAWADLDW